MWLEDLDIFEEASGVSGGEPNALPDDYRTQVHDSLLLVEHEMAARGLTLHAPQRHGREAGKTLQLCPEQHSH